MSPHPLSWMGVWVPWPTLLIVLVAWVWTVLCGYWLGKWGEEERRDGRP